MNNKFTADRIKKHLHYDWYKYVACILAAVLVFTLMYTWAGNYRDHEVLGGMFTCYDWYDTDFERDALDYLNKNVDGNTVKDLAIQEVSAQSPNWPDVMQSYGLSRRTAFLVIPESQIEQYAKTFMCLYDGSEYAAYYNRNVWERIIPEELKTHYAPADNLDSYADRIYKSETGASEEKVEDIYAELNAINENVYYAKNSKGVLGVYALRIDNLLNIKSNVNFSHKSTDDEKYYLLMHYRNSNVGQYGLDPKTHAHNEAFYLVNFLLTRYGVPV